MMSLSSHLNDPTSPIGQFLKVRFAKTAPLTRAANQRLKTMEIVRPVHADPSHPYALIGMAIDYRIRYAFEMTPSRRLVAWKGALLLATKRKEREDDPLFDWDSVPAGMALPLPGGISGNPFEVARGPYSRALLQAFFDRLDATVHALRPVGRLLNEDEEYLLGRYCLVLSLFEQVFRSGIQRGPLFQPVVRQSVEALLALPQDHWLDDLSQLFRLFYERYYHMLVLPHLLNPTFAGSHDVGGADADLVIDGCLIDIKTSISSQVKAEYLYQLAGYLLLDYDNLLQLQTLGIYMARQGLLVTWPVAEFLHQLTGDDRVTLTSLRQTFRGICQQAGASR
jgi:hypothetical protein